MIGFRYPVQGLQLFTKTFGQPLHEPDVQDLNFDEVHQKSRQEEEEEEVGVDPKLIASQIEKSLGFSYDSDGDESDVSMPEDTPEPLEDNSQFLAEHTDILPADAPIDTINTLKALKYHIETSENRCFTNLERQLLATIVQHGIFNANKEEAVPKKAEDDVHESSSHEANATSPSMTLIKESNHKGSSHEAKVTSSSITSIEESNHKSSSHESNDTSFSMASINESNHKSSSDMANVNSSSMTFINEINHKSSSHTANVTASSMMLIKESNHKSSSHMDNATSSMTPIKESNHESSNHEANTTSSSMPSIKESTKIVQPLENNQDQKKAEINTDVQLVSRKALLPTPGSYDEISHVLMEDEVEKNFSRRTVPIEEQRRMSKTVKSLKVNEKLLKIQNSYHPDDEPTLELLESMAKRNEEESAYDDLLNSYSKTQSEKSKEKEPKYKSKTKILPPPDFLKRQERHYQTRHERPQQELHGSNRRVVRREDYDREKKEQPGYEPGRRRVKLQYREDVQYDRCSSRDHPNPVGDRKRKKTPVECGGKTILSNEATADDPKEKAVDILASLITQQFLSKMTEDTQMKNVENSVNHPEKSESPTQSVDSPPQLAPLNPLKSFQLPPFISSATKAVSTAQAPISATLPFHSIPAPLPIITAPMMSHPGLISDSRRNLIKIDCNNVPPGTEPVPLLDEFELNGTPLNINRTVKKRKKKSVGSKIEPGPHGISKTVKESSPKLTITMNPDSSNTKVVVIEDDIEEGEID